jgi:hypothetical protein
MISLPTHLGRKLASAVVFIVLVAAASAAAYWTTSGSGTGSASTGAGTSTVTVTQTTAVSGLYPGGPNQDIEFKITNPTSGPLHIASVSASITSITRGGSAVSGCTASDFSLTQAPTAVNADVAAGDTFFTGNQTPKVKMLNSGSNQDACKGVTVNLSFSAA